MISCRDYFVEQRPLNKDKYLFQRLQHKAGKVTKMISILRALIVCFCLCHSLGEPRGVKHVIAKRWAYIENGDPQMRSIHTDCKEIVKEYSDGELPFYEYTAKMGKCMNRQQRTNIPSYDDTDFFTPTFNTPAGSKRFETPNNVQQPSTQYGDNAYANVRDDVAAPQTPQYTAPQAPQYAAPQAQAFPATNTNYYQQPAQGGLTTRNEIPSYQVNY